tara:strand:+ start:384 stop:1007 length:624 start_codon:yes stop_codon:yes gene_type:complete
MKIMYRKLVFTFMLLSMVTQLSAKGELMRSLVFPGWGELKMEESKRAKMFMATDLSIIATYLLGKSFNRWYIDKYLAYGTLYADADMNGKDYAYIVNMSNYDSMDSYNHSMMIQHNANAFDEIYTDQEYNWEWDSVADRNKFNDLRENSLIAEKIAEFAVAGLILNRVASAIDILYLKNSKSNLGLNAFVIPEKNDGVSLNVSFSFK